MIKHYILDENMRVKRATLGEWAEWFESPSNTIIFLHMFKDCRVSTIFLGLDHGWEEGGPPVLWETMVFGGPLDHQQCRCAGTIEQAEAMHVAMVNKVHASLTGLTQ